MTIKSTGTKMNTSVYAPAMTKDLRVIYTRYVRYIDMLRIVNVQEKMCLL